MQSGQPACSMFSILAQFVDRLGVPHKFEPFEMWAVLVQTLPLLPNTENPDFNSDTFIIIV